MENKKSMINVAYEQLKQARKTVGFAELYNLVCEDLHLTDDQKKKAIARFYTDISLDGRFIALPGNNWDLKEHKTSEEVRSTLKVAYDEDEEENVSYGDDDDDDELEESIGNNNDTENPKSRFDDSTDEESEEDEKKPSYDL